ncbi:MAG: hypothetical protein ACPGD8_06360 [Flavobacteriales bacterium]
MKLNAALNQFEALASNTNSKRERKVHDKFVGIFSDLINRDLTEEQILSIEEKVDELELQMAHSTSWWKLRRKLSSFTQHLQNELSLVTAEYYTALGLTFGVALGVALAPMLERLFGISISMGIGMLIGLIVGQYLDAKAAKENRVLRTTRL